MTTPVPTIGRRPASSGVYNEVSTFTVDVLRRRARTYRTLVVAVVLVCASSVAAAVALWSWRPLSALTLVLWFCGVFFALDAWSVAQWRGRVLKAWVEGAFDLETFRRMIAGRSDLPQRTLSAMLGPLPKGECERAVSTDPRMRSWLVIMLGGIHARQTYRAVAVALATAIAAIAVMAAARSLSWTPLTALAATPLPIVLARIIAVRRLQRDAERACPIPAGGIESEAFRRAAAELDWVLIPAAERDARLAALTRPGDSRALTDPR
jgi:hypothetical protein